MDEIFGTAAGEKQAPHAGQGIQSIHIRLGYLGSEACTVVGGHPVLAASG